MFQSKIAGIGYYVPEKVVTNNDLAKVMDTTDEWIQERTGIKERRYGEKHKETTATMGAEAAPPILAAEAMATVCMSTRNTHAPARINTP